MQESQLRRIDFSPGPRAKLADGQEWTFPRPRLRFRASRDASGTLGLNGGWTYDREYEDIRNKIIDCDSDDTFALFNLQAQATANLLLRNYDLTDEQLGELIVFDFEDQANVEMWENLSPIIFANPPKHSADGSVQP